MTHKLLVATAALIFGKPMEIIDHVEVAPQACNFQTLRDKAALRHGKPFRSDQLVPRETPPSRALGEIEQEVRRAKRRLNHKEAQ